MSTQPAIGSGNPSFIPKPKQKRKSVRLSTKQLQIVKMLSTGNMTLQAVADKLGCSLQLAKLASSKMKRLEPGPEDELAQYRNLLRKRMPDTKRVSAIAEVMQDGSEFARLKAVEYTDTMLGLGPKQQPVEHQEAQIRPMFYLPAGAEININIGSTPQHIDIKAENEQS